MREIKSKMVERINELIAELGWEPTDEIVVQGAVGSSWEPPISTGGNAGGGPLPQIKLPDRQQEPFIV